MDTIINGSKNPTFRGLLYYAKKYVHEVETSEDVRNSYKVKICDFLRNFRKLSTKNTFFLNRYVLKKLA